MAKLTNGSLNQDWRDRPEVGSGLALRLTVLVARFFGRPILRLVLYPITFYFFLFRHKERAASRDFLTRVYSRPPRRREIFRHFLTFSGVIADRVYFLTNEIDRFPVTLHNIPEMQELVDMRKGGLVLAAHLGSFEAARILGVKVSDVVLRVVLDRSINPKLMNQLEALDSDLSDAVIDAGGSSAALGLKIAEAFDRGEWIGFLADRYRPGDRTTEVDLLGGKIRLPLGPLIIAATFKVPLVAIFPIYMNGGYEIHCEILSSSFDLPRENRDAELQIYAQLFARNMEKYIRLAPCNWFNFYKYWDN